MDEYAKRFGERQTYHLSQGKSLDQAVRLAHSDMNEIIAMRDGVAVAPLSSTDRITMLTDQHRAAGKTLDQAVRLAYKEVAGLA